MHAPQLPSQQKSTGYTEPIISILSFGGHPDGVGYNNAAIQSALSYLEARAGGNAPTGTGTPWGTLYFPPGTYKASPFNITLPVGLTLLLDNATLSASTTFTDWPLIAPLPSYGTGRDFAPSLTRYDSFLHVWNATGFRLTSNSTGTVDGNGGPWWEAKMSGRISSTPGHLVEILYSSDVELDTVTLRDSPFWTTHIYACDGVHMHDMVIRADPPLLAYNTDGIDPDSSSNVLIERVDVRTGDDGVAIKSGWDEPGQAYGRPCVNITVRDSVFYAPKGACVAVGSETSGGVYNVSVRNITCLGGSRYGVGVKSGPGRGSEVKSITFEGIHVTAGLPFNNSVLWLGTLWADHNPMGCNVSDLPLLTGIHFKDVSVQGPVGSSTGGAAAIFEGLDKLPMIDITVEDVDLPGATPWQCNGGVQGIAQGTVVPQPCAPQFQPGPAREGV